MNPKDVERERACFEFLNAIAREDVVLVGGYAVSSYGQPRFSVDLDIVVSSRAVEHIRRRLERRGFRKEKSWDGGGIFSGESERWALPGSPSTSVDLLIDGLHDRGTTLSFSFDELRERAETREVVGFGTNSRATFTVAAPEVLVALKLVAGRKSDIRDIAVLSRIPLETEAISGLLAKASPDLLRGRLNDIRRAVETDEFRNSVQGVFVLDGRAYPAIRQSTLRLCDRLSGLPVSSS